MLSNYLFQDIFVPLGDRPFWNNRWSNTFGYSRVRIYNAEAQAANAFKRGDYAIVNLLHQPFPQFLTGAELQWGERKNFSDGFSVSALRVQISFKYNLSHSFFKNVNKQMADE